MKIDFDEEKHEYSVGGIRIPSVSEILAPLSAERYGELNPWMVKAAAARGTAVHEGTQLIDFDIAPEYDAEIDGYLMAYQMFLLEHEVEWHMVETVVSYQRLADELPLYAGTLDRYGLVDGVPTIVDIKTYASLSTDAQLAASCQTALYRDAIDQALSQIVTTWDRERRAILHLRKDGTYRYVDLDKWDGEHGFNSRECAWSLYNVWAWKDAARKTVRRGKIKTTTEKGK